MVILLCSLVSVWGLHLEVKFLRTLRVSVCPTLVVNASFLEWLISLHYH